MKNQKTRFLDVQQIPKALKFLIPVFQKKFLGDLGLNLLIYLLLNAFCE